MLQQTTVAAVKPYFLSFLERWPNVGALAAAPLDDVMRAWAGLGYYSRARNLHACAICVAGRPGGNFPSDENSLLELPGVGAYTAAAIAAIAFDRRAVVVDGNVERVVSRMFAIAEPLPKAKREIRLKADELTPMQRPGDFAQAMMDLGATICTPKRPACSLCPLNEDCRAYKNGAAESYPVKRPRAPRPRRSGSVFYLRRADGAILIRTRPPSGLLGGMTEFPGTPWTEAGPSDSLAAAPVAAEWKKAAGAVEHVFTHFALDLTVYRADAAIGTPAPAGCRWTDESELENEALPSLMRKVAALAQAC